MVDHATERTNIMASPDQCFAAATDFENYPLWASDIKHAKVLNHDDQGRAIDVEYTVAAMGRSTSCILRYAYGSDPLRLSWQMKSSDAITRMDGEYEFKPVLDDLVGQKGRAGSDTIHGDTTEVSYHLAVELAVPLSGFVKRRVESRIMQVALDDLKAYIEASAHG